MTMTDGPWSSLQRDERVGSHISQAGVALDGSIIVRGAIEHPIDEKRHFPPHGGNELRISRIHGMRIVRCQSLRDASGFLQVAEFGGEIHVPPPLASIIERAFRFGVKEPVSACLDYQVGQLSDSTSTIKTRVQPLTGWALHIIEIEGTIEVRLSAKLCATILESWNTSQSNYWGEDSASKIEATFGIRPETRIACYDSYVSALDQGDALPAFVPDTSEDRVLNIGDAPVGTMTQFAISGNRWLHFYENSESRSLSITEHDAPKRTTLGFLADSRGYRWPRMRVQGIDMDGIAAGLSAANSMRLTLSDGIFGDLSHGGPEGWSVEIIGVNLLVEVTGAGLKFTYEVKTATSERSGEFYLIWELLLLRYPKFARYRQPSR